MNPAPPVISIFTSDVPLSTQAGLASANDPSRSKGTVFERAEPPAEEKQAPWSSAPVGLKCSRIDSMALAVLTGRHSQPGNHSAVGRDRR